MGARGATRLRQYAHGMVKVSVLGGLDNHTSWLTKTDSIAYHIMDLQILHRMLYTYDCRKIHSIRACGSGFVLPPSPVAPHREGLADI